MTVKRRGSKTTAAWPCPVCGRKFAKTNQWHSCGAKSIATHFRGKDAQLRTVFDSLVRKLKATGPIRVDSVASSINLISKHHFGGIAVRRDYLRVGFIADHEIQDPRIVRVERITPRRIGHFVLLRETADVDEQLVGWLAEAQALQA